MQRSLGIAFVLLAAGCGRSALPSADDLPCSHVAWSACAPLPKISLGEGDMPDIAWTGQELLVVTSVMFSSSLLHLDLRGNVISAASLPLSQGSRIAWNPAKDVGVVLGPDGIVALDGQGNIGTALSPFDLAADAVDVMPTPQGFLAIKTEHAYMTVGTTTTSVYSVVSAALAPNQTSTTWSPLADGYAMHIEHAVDGEGFGTSFALRPFATTTTIQGLPGSRYLVENGAPGSSTTLDVPATSANSGDVVALADSPEGALLLYGGILPDQNSNDWVLWLEDPSSAAQAKRIDRAPNGPDGAFVHVGADLVLASSTIDPEDRMSVAPIDPTLPGRPVGGRIVLAESPHLSRSARAVPTPRGFAMVWWEGVSIDDGVQLQVFDCCADDH